MSAKFKLATHYKKGFEYFCVNIEDIPHTEEYLEKGNIKFYGVPPGIFVLAYDDKTAKPVLSEITAWSEHTGCKIVTVELHSGRQILTDDDPRAVYGYDPIMNEFGRWRPKDAVGKFVPRVHTLPEIFDEAIKEVPVESKLRLLPKMKLNYSSGWLLGALVGDGWVSNHKGNISAVCLAAINDGIIAQFRESLLQIFVDDPKITSKESKGSYGRSTKHTVSSREFAAFIKPLIGNKAQGKHLPPFYLSASKEFRLGLLAGLMDTDGSVSISNGKKKPQLMSNFGSVSLRLVQEVQHLLRSLKIGSRITESNTPAGEKFWTLNIYAGELKASGIKLCHTEKKKIIEEGPTPNLDSPAAAKADMLPLNPALCEELMRLANEQRMINKKAYSLYSTFSHAKKSMVLSRILTKRCIEFFDGNVEHSAWDVLKKMAVNTDVRWDRVDGYTETDIVETGYDITVPDSETFMSVDGTILSNTANFHVPVSEEAKKEVMEKMLPSRNLISVKDFRAHYLPSQEYQGGLYHATSAKDDKRPHVFATKADALRAYHEGKIDLKTNVEVVKH